MKNSFKEQKEFEALEIKIETTEEQNNNLHDINNKLMADCESQEQNIEKNEYENQVKKIAEFEGVRSLVVDDDGNLKKYCSVFTRWWHFHFGMCKPRNFN